jgi:hypothetical protein
MPILTRRYKGTCGPEKPSALANDPLLQSSRRHTISGTSDHATLPGHFARESPSLRASSPIKNPRFLSISMARTAVEAFKSWCLPRREMRRD